MDAPFVGFIISSDTPMVGRKAQKTTAAASPACAEGSGSSTFIDLLIMVPQLANACFNLDCPPDDPEYGLKSLRLLCKEARQFSRRVMRAYTLLLGAADQPELDTIVKFLEGINLLRLKIVFYRVEVNGEGKKVPSHACNMFMCMSEETILENRFEPELKLWLSLCSSLSPCFLG